MFRPPQGGIASLVFYDGTKENGAIQVIFGSHRCGEIPYPNVFGDEYKRLMRMMWNTSIAIKLWRWICSRVKFLCTMKHLRTDQPPTGGIELISFP